ncbi:hypothetical protein [Calidifontibacter indicus]|uniref:hypothetical protein n=1 Tax=Calidifontibacter indicus TaxID=419650 RepID=UPI003D7143E4
MDEVGGGISGGEVRDPARELAWLPVGLEMAALRLVRVDECIYRIGDLASQWSLENPLVLQQRRRKDGNVRAVVSAVRPVPPLAALLFSEAVHLRSVLDNVVWFLAARVHPTEELSDSARRAIALPVHTDPNRYDKWAGARVKDGLAVFAPSHNIGARIRRVQPFADASSSVASSSEIMAYLMGAQVERAHPLQLLQGYSNDDKHRTIRIGVPRATSTRLDQPLLGQNRGFREMAV